MKLRSRSSFVSSLVLAALTIAGGTALSMQWRQSMELRAALERATIDADEVARLRSDHAVLPRLRAKLEALQHPPSAAR